jgi:type II secretory pathway pseudopilin PulG
MPLIMSLKLRVNAPDFSASPEATKAAAEAAAAAQAAAAAAAALEAAQAAQAAPQRPSPPPTPSSGGQSNNTPMLTPQTSLDVLAVGRNINGAAGPFLGLGAAGAVKGGLAPIVAWQGALACHGRPCCHGFHLRHCC